MMAAAVSYELKRPLKEILLWKIKEIKDQYCCTNAYVEIAKEKTENG